MSATEHLDAVGVTLDKVDELVSSLEERIDELALHAKNYAESVHAERAAGGSPSRYSGSSSHQLAQQLVQRLTAAHREVHAISNELVRFGS